MIINQETLGAIFTAFKTLFGKGLESAPSAYKQIAMTVPSSTREEVYAWLGQFPGMREWLGPRVVKNLSAHGFKIVNRDFESTVSVPRNDIEDDRYGVFGPVMSEMGRAAGEHPDQLIFSLLSAGFATNCYDGQSSSTPIIQSAMARTARSRALATCSREPARRGSSSIRAGR